MARFLVTGARSPVALELTRNLAQHGHDVFLADSLRFPLARHSRYVRKTYFIESPRKCLLQFQDDIVAIVKNENIDVLIPTCEEVFYVSVIKSALESHVKVFSPNFSLMKTFHSKYQIYKAANGCGFINPSTEVITGRKLLDRNDYRGKVVKREFCRFGTGVLIEPSFNEVRKLVDNKLDGQFVIQNKVEGIECCTYAVANNGKVVFESVYTPKHRVRKAAGIYFEPVYSKDISLAVSVFCEKHKITGQIGFDVVINDSGIYLLECNPRATSGLHLLAEKDLSKGFLGGEVYTNYADELDEPKMIGLAMLLICLPIAICKSQFRNWKRDFSAAVDVVSVQSDRSFILFSFMALLELCVISIRTRSSLRAASTFDIEWDGEELDEQ